MAVKHRAIDRVKISGAANGQLDDGPDVFPCRARGRHRRDRQANPPIDDKAGADQRDGHVLKIVPEKSELTRGHIFAAVPETGEHAQMLDFELRRLGLSEFECAGRFEDIAVESTLEPDV